MGTADLGLILATLAVFLWLGMTRDGMSWTVRLVMGAAGLTLTGWHLLS